MAILRNDKLANTLPGIITNSRFTNWLWVFLKHRYPITYLGEFRSPGMRDRMADLIINTPNLSHEIEQNQSSMLLPENTLKWITDSKRQHTWINNNITGRAGYFLSDTPPNLPDRETIITKIDAWVTTQTTKQIQISQIASAWELQKNVDQAFQWFHEEDENKKCELAWKIFIKDNPLLALGNDPFTNHEELLIFFDNTLKLPAERKLFIQTVKSRWSQNKYRTKETDKKQYNFILSKKTIQRLDKLAEKYDLKRTQILDILLQMEEDKGIYIPEKLKPLKNI